MTALSSASGFVRARQSALFPILDVLLNAFNWGFHILVSRALLPGDYATLNALLALLALFMVLGVSLQLLTARHVAAHGLDDARALQGLALWTAGSVVALGTLFLPLLMWLTRATAPCILLVLVIFGMNAVLSVRRGLAQGQTTFLSLNGSFYLEVVVKLAATVALLHIWPRPEMALLGVLLGMLAALLLSLRGPMPPSPKTARPTPVRFWLAQLAPVFAASFFLYFFSSVDMLLVIRLLPAQAGTYAVAAKYGQILFFAALSVATVFVPQLSRARALGDGAQFLTLTKKLLGVLGAFCLVTLALSCTLFPLTVGPMFGAVYAPAGALLPLAVLTYSLLALCFALVNVLVVSEVRSYLYALALAGAVLVISLLMWHGTLAAVLTVLAGVYGALLLGLGALWKSHVTQSSS